MGELPLSLRLDAQTRQELEREARLQDMSEAELAARAIKSYLEVREHDRRIMRGRLAEAGEGIFISEEAMTGWVESWGTENELPPPDPDILPAGRA
jgi:predicted transcriptional regulator